MVEILDKDNKTGKESDDGKSDSKINERRYCLMFLRDTDINGNYTGNLGSWTFNKNKKGYVYEVFE